MATAVSAVQVPIPSLPPLAISNTYTLTEDTPLTTTPAASWFDSQWRWRQQLALVNIGGTVLQDQPVLLTLDSSRLDQARVQSEGQDLRFVDHDGTLQAHEIEDWNPAGVSRVWVRVPQIDANSNSDSFWVYYGNSAAADAQQPIPVWSGNYASVLHLQGPPTDATNGALLSNTGTSSAGGVISGARQFTSSGAALTMNAAPQLNDLFAP